MAMENLQKKERERGEREGGGKLFNLMNSIFFIVGGPGYETTVLALLSSLKPSGKLGQEEAQPITYTY